MKKYRLFLLVSVLAISCIAYATFASVTVRSRTTNVITTGNVSIELSQNTIDAQGNVVPLDTQRVVQIVPGSSSSQMPYVKNVGTEDCYVRVRLTPKVIASDGTTVLPNQLSFDIDPTQWLLDADGWYRYRNIVPVGVTTGVPLFTTVTFSSEMDNRYLNATMQISLIAQGVQAEYNAGEASVLEVTGWPSTATVGGATE